MINKVQHSIDSRTVVIFIIIVLGFFVLWRLADVFLIIITALMLAAALSPAVEWLHKKLPRPLSATIAVLGLLLPFIAVLFNIVPQFVPQIPSLVNSIDGGLHQSIYFKQILHNVDISQYYAQGGQYLIESTSKITDIVRNFIILIILTLYLLIDSDRLHRMFAPLFSSKQRTKAEETSRSIAKISGQYIRGNLLISLICSILILIGLLLLHIPYAVPLAIFAGILDLLPLAGAIVGMLPSVILGFTISPIIGLLTIALFLVYQEFENAVLAPNIYNKALNLAPSLSLIAVIIGGSLLGIPGAFLALPVAASIPTIIKYFKE